MLKTLLRLSGRVHERRHKWWALVAMITCISMMMIDQTVLPLALPTIQRQFELSNVMLQWIVNAYMLSVAAVVLAGGRLADLVGKRFIFCLGSIIFAIASAAGGAAGAGWWLVISRAAQGIGAALMGPATMAIIVDTFAPGQRGKAIGIYIGSGALFLSLGPIIGGFLTNYLSWRWIFWINLPISIVGIILALAFVKPSPLVKERFSLGSYITFGLSIIFLVMVLMQGKEWGWLSWEILLLEALFIASLTSFYMLDKREEHPAIDLELFRIRTFVTSCTILFFMQFVLMVTIFWSLYFQNSLGYTPMQTGWITSITCIPIIAVPIIAGHVSDRFGPKIPIVIGLVLTLLCFVWFAWHKDASTFHTLVPALLAFGCGIGFVNSPTSASALSSVPPSKRGSASGTTSAVRWLGGTMGVALLGAVLNNIQFHTFESLLSQNPMTSKLDPQLFEGLFSRRHGTIAALNQLKAGAAKWVEGSLHDSFLLAFWGMNLTAAGVTLGVLIFVLIFLKKHRKPSTQSMKK